MPTSSVLEAKRNTSESETSKNLADIEILQRLGVQEHHAQSFLAWRTMEINGTETEISVQRLVELRTHYGAELLARVR